MSDALSGRRVLISGGTAGIGLATARHLAAAGAAVAVMGRDSLRLSAAQRHLPGATAFAGDVTREADCADAVAMAVERFGGLDAIVHSAGVATISPLPDLAGAEFREMVEVNLIGAFNLCRAALPALRGSARGDIVLIGSRAGRYAFAGGTGYCAAKAGLQGFAEALFLDLSPEGIAVSLVAPGTVDTGFAGVAGQDWHLQADDVAEAIGHCLAGHRRANLNWVEMRPSRRDG